LLPAIGLTAAITADNASLATWLTLTQTEDAKKQTQSMIATSDGVLLVNPDGKVEAQYLRDADELWLVDSTSRQLQRLDVATGRLFAERLSTQLQQLEAQLDKLPPEQRKLSELRMQQLFAGNSEQLLPTPDEIVKTQAKGIFAGVKCTHYSMKTAGQAIGDACIADPKDIRHGDSITSMTSLVRRIYADIQSVGPNYVPLVLPSAPMLTLAASAGIPMQVTLFEEAGEVLRTLAIRDVRLAPIPPNLLTELDGYKRVDMFDVTDVGQR